MSAKQDELTRIEQRLRRALGHTTRGAPSRLRSAMGYGLLGGGKRLRASLALGAQRALGRRPSPAIWDYACALEMVHAYSLMHDDLPAMDDDDLRRGKPSTHKAFGEAAAILAGDALLTDAFALISRGSRDALFRARLSGELAAAAGSSGMVGGQVLDLEGSARTRAQLAEVHALKTGALICAAARGPALQDGIDSAHRAALGAYGRNLGLAFQIVDDLLDVRGDPRKVGKAVAKDHARGRVTYPSLLGIDGAEAAADRAVAAASRALQSLPGRTDRLEALLRAARHREA